MKGLEESIREPLPGYSSDDMEDPLLLKSDGISPPNYVRRRSRSKLFLLLACFFALPVFLFVSMHAWSPRFPDHHRGHLPGGKMRPPHGPTPVQCQLLSTATPALNISLDPLHFHSGPHSPPPPPPPDHRRPGPPRHRRPPPPPPPHFFIDRTLNGAKSITVLRSGPILPPPPPPTHDEQDGKHPTGPRPEPIRVELFVDLPGRQADLVDVQRIINQQTHADKQSVKFEELHICVVSDGPGSLGVAAFPQDPLKEKQSKGLDQQPDSDNFAEVINAIAIKMHLPAHFPSATLDLHLPPHPPPPPHHPHGRPFPC